MEGCVASSPNGQCLPKRSENLSGWSKLFWRQHYSTGWHNNKKVLLYGIHKEKHDSRWCVNAKCTTCEPNLLFSRYRKFNWSDFSLKDTVISFSYFKFHDTKIAPYREERWQCKKISTSVLDVKILAGPSSVVTDGLTTVWLLVGESSVSKKSSAVSHSHSFAFTQTAQKVF